MSDTLFNLPDPSPEWQHSDERLSSKERRERLYRSWRRMHPEHRDLPDRIVGMYALHGTDAGARQCKTCSNCIAEEYHNRRYYKCAMSRQSRGAATDWRLSWLACGVYKPIEGDRVTNIYME